MSLELTTALLIWSSSLVCVYLYFHKGFTFYGDYCSSDGLFWVFVPYSAGLFVALEEQTVCSFGWLNPGQVGAEVIGRKRCVIYVRMFESSLANHSYGKGRGGSSLHSHTLTVTSRTAGSEKHSSWNKLIPSCPFCSSDFLEVPHTCLYNQHVPSPPHSSQSTCRHLQHKSLTWPCQDHLPRWECC
jgi:hypothetical protein